MKKLAGSKTICKKSPTKFQEFRLSHSKPRVRGRRALLEDLYKTSEKDGQQQIGLLQKRQKTLTEKSMGATSSQSEKPETMSLGNVARRLFK